MKLRKLLLVAYHFPPIQGSTGTSRIIAFSRYLAAYGWDIQVLTIRPGAYEDTAVENERLLPKNISIKRAWGVDARRSLSIFGKYPRILALPDRWQSWIAGGIYSGLGICRSWKPDVVMTTYPIASAHVIGYALHKLCKIPWVAEFRDPMFQTNYPVNRLDRIAFEKVERLTFKYAKEIVVTTDSCRQLYVDRYATSTSASVSVISNGYDPELFENITVRAKLKKTRRMVILHSGLLYPHERNPTAFFQAVSGLAASDRLNDLDVEFRFRASGNDDEYLAEIRRLGIDPYIRLLPRIPYEEAIEEMASVDALMIFQSASCNDQIPAKIYEYMYCRKPILAFTDPRGSTGTLLRSVGVPHIAALEDAREISKVLVDFLHDLRDGRPFVVSAGDASQFSRKKLTGSLDLVLRRAIAQGT